MSRVYLSLGTNIERYRHMTAALNALNETFGVVRLSAVYESEAVGFEGAHFLNAVAAIDTDWTCSALNLWLKALEDGYGRKRDVAKFSPRTLDVDILLFGDLNGDNDGVILPRSEITFNAFVLKPLAELAPNMMHPTLHQSMAALWEAFDQQSQVLWQVPFNWTPAPVGQ